MGSNQTADAVVIGGGSVGTAIACYLAMDGMKPVLIEKGEFAWGSSRRCEGHVVTYDSVPGTHSIFCKTGQDMFYEAEKFLPVDFDFKPEGIGLLVDDERHLEIVKKNYEGKLKEGYNVTLWDRDDLKRNEPNIGSNILASLNFNNDCTLNPMRLCFGLAKHAEAHGATMQLKTNVTDIRLKDGRVNSVVTDQGEIFTKHVVLAAGVWTPELGDMVGVNIPVRPRQGHIMVTERVNGLLNKAYVEYGYLLAKGGEKQEHVTPDMEKFGVAFVIEPSSAGTVLVGSSRRFVGMDIRPHPAVLRAIAERAKHFYPAIAKTRILRCYAGVRPCSPDAKPIISTTHVPGVYVATGHEGNGISLSLITGKLITQFIAGQEPFIQVDYMSLDRFKANPPAIPPGSNM